MHGIWKRLARGFVALALLLGTVPQVQAVSVFSDMDEKHWAYQEILQFYQQNIVSGLPDGRFAPNEGVTREQFAKMLVLTFQAEQVFPDMPTFRDVAPDHWSYGYIETAKEFLTGYTSPFDGSKTFRPLTMATREDIAVALVSMLGWTAQDVKDPDVVEKFLDYEAISPELLPYVAIAVERNLMRGYANGTFAPTEEITRAETVTLLSRAMKQAMNDDTQTLRVEASVLKGQRLDEIYILVQATLDTKITVNGKPLVMKPESFYYEALGYEEVYVQFGDAYNSMGLYFHQFTKEGTQDFVIHAKKGKQEKSITVTAEYEVAVPELTLTHCPSVVRENTVTLTGRVYDAGYALTLHINGEEIALQRDGSFSKTFALRLGENQFLFVLQNARGKRVTETRTVEALWETPAVPQPEPVPQPPDVTAEPVSLQILACPERVQEAVCTVQGVVNNAPAGNVFLSLNGKRVDLDERQAFSLSVSLEAGENTLVFLLRTARGEEISQTCTVYYDLPSVDAPTEATEL